MTKLKSWTTTGGYRIIRVLGGRSNVFLVTNGKQNILVDTTIRFDRGKLKKRLEKLGINHINYLVLTHSHFDHTGNARWIRERYNTKVIIHNEEVPALESGLAPIPPATFRFAKILVKLSSSGFAPELKSEPCPCDMTTDEIDLPAEGINAVILHTPGHTPGSVSVIVDDEIALVGDAMFGAFPGTVLPPFAHDIPMMVQSWGKLLETGCNLFIPAHGSASTRQMVEKDYYRRLKG